MDDRETRQLAAAADRAEAARLDAEIVAALERHGIITIEVPRPGFAARRRDRMLRPAHTRSEG